MYSSSKNFLSVLLVSSSCKEISSEYESKGVVISIRKL